MELHRNDAEEIYGLPNLDTDLSLSGGIMDFEANDTVGGYAVPVDPMDMLQCDSCQ